MNTPVKLPPALDPLPGAQSTKRGPIVVAVLVAMISAALLPSEDRKLVPYLDPPGILTVCMGITGADARRHPGTPYTVEECKVLERVYLTRMVNDMGRCISPEIQKQMNYQEWTAYGHWAYNTGTGAFCHSTLNRRLNAGDHAGACKAMGSWNKITMPLSFLPRAGRHQVVVLPNGHKKLVVDCSDTKNRCSGIARRRGYEVQRCLAAL